MLSRFTMTRVYSRISLQRAYCKDHLQRTFQGTVQRISSSPTFLLSKLQPLRAFSSTHLSPQEIQSRTLTLLSSFAKLTTKTPLPESKFKSDLGLDSLDVVEVVMAVEEEFGLNIPDEVADGFESPADVIKYLESKLSH